MEKVNVKWDKILRVVRCNSFGHSSKTCKSPAGGKCNETIVVVVGRAHEVGGERQGDCAAREGGATLMGFF